ncbi:N-sulphoglucosamine sulphohydrolase-like [Littorina saxatilis]
MYYPMRVVRTPQYRLIHNLNYKGPYGMATDIYGSPTFLDILNRTMTGQPTHWFKTLDQYYYRPQWELFDLHSDPQELHNLADDPGHQSVMNELRAELLSWQAQTHDPWRCLPGGELLNGPSCFPLDNGEDGMNKYRAEL